jgi:hypothetical protein
MPGSSPVKGGKSGKALVAAKDAAATRPFAPLDLNLVGARVKTFQETREKAGATPPPSSPPASSVFLSSPVTQPRQQELGFSPVKQQRAFTPRTQPSRDSTVGAPGDRAQELGNQLLGLVPNTELDADTDAVPNLLFGSKSVSLVIGRSKPSGEPHAMAAHDASQQSAAGDIPPSMQGLGAKKVLRVNLPNDARHVSRIHAIVEWIPFVARAAASKKQTVSSFTAKGSPVGARLASQSNASGANGTFIVRIVGQNGLIVEGKRRREGQVLRLTPGKTLIDFFGVKCRFEHVPSSTDRRASPVKSSQARVQEWTQRVTSPVKKGAADVQAPVTTQALESMPVSSPPASSPPHMLGLLSPSKRANNNRGRASAADAEDEEADEVHSSPTPAHRRGGGLVAGPLNAQQVRAGDSDEEMASGAKALLDDDDDDDEDDESDDEDYVPAEFEPKLKSVSSPRKPVAAIAALDDDSSSLSDSDAVDEQIGDAALATQPTLATATRKGTLTSEGTTSKAAVAGDLTESQAKMPPPAATVAAVRNSARRSASNSPAPSSPLLGSSVQELQKLARNGVSQLAPTYDLPGLLAGAIVFHRTATISASEAVRSVLTTTPGLMKGQAGEHSVAFSPSKRKLPGAATLQQGCTVDGWPTQSEGGERWTSIARKAWREHLEVVLQSSPMFGVIQRAGKDASGNPLECWYYYDKENDPDKERAENLGVFAKPMRKALKGQKPIFWKRSGYASRQDEVAEVKPEASSSSSSLVGEQESIDIASAPLPSSSMANGRKRKAGAMSQTQAETQTAGAGAADDEARRREKLRVKIARSGLWDETQPEEKEAPTWDRKGDQDYRKGRK